MEVFAFINIFGPPYPAEQRGVREYLACPEYQLLQEIIFGGGQLDVTIPDSYSSLYEVDLQVTAGEVWRGLLFLVALGAAQYCQYP